MRGQTSSLTIRLWSHDMKVVRVSSITMSLVLFRKGTQAHLYAHTCVCTMERVFACVYLIRLPMILYKDETRSLTDELNIMLHGESLRICREISRTVWMHWFSLNYLGRPLDGASVFVFALAETFSSTNIQLLVRRTILDISHKADNSYLTRNQVSAFYRETCCRLLKIWAMI